MTRLYSNNFSTTLNGAITAIATSMTLTSVTGFPAVGSGDTCQITLDDGAGNVEVVTATAIAGSVITITRAQEGTSGFAFADADPVELRITALSHTDVLAADLTPALAGPLDMSASGVYASFGGSSSATAYNITNAGNVPVMTGAANYKYTFTSTSLVMNAGTSWYSMVLANSGGFTLTTNNVVRIQANNSGVQFGATGARITHIIDDDTMGTASAVTLATSESIKAYADSVGGGAPEGTAVLSTGEVGGTKFLREDGDGTCSWISIPGGGDALVANPLSQFAATTSLQFKGVISDETGSGSVVFATSPTLTTPAISGNMTTTGTIDGRDVAVDGTKLDGVEALADVTDVTNVTAAGALMDSEVDVNLKTLVLPASTTISTFGASLIDDTTSTAARTTLGVDAAGVDNSTDVTLAGTGTYLSLAGQAITVDPITESDISDLGSYQPLTTVLTNTTASFLSADETKLDGIEAAADVTDVTNVTAAGAVMDSELTSITDVKALNQSVVSGAAPTFAATNMTGTASGLTAGNVTTNANLTGDVTSSGNATTIAAGSVDVAMLANGVDGELITWDATGAPATVAVGTATHVLTSNGVGVAPTFQAPAGGGGGLADVVDDTTPQLGGELELNGNYIDFGVSSTATAYNLVSSGGVPRLTGAANYYYTFTSTSLDMQAGTSFYKIQMHNSNGFTATTNNVARIQANNSGVQFGATGARITHTIDDDAMATASAVTLATSESIKAYVDSGLYASFIGFRATRTTAQSLTSGVDSKIQLATENYDTEGDFDPTTNYRHTPSIAGKWLYVATVGLASITDQKVVVTKISKNGTGIAEGVNRMSSASAIESIVQASAVLDMNGSTDYVELYTYHDVGSSVNTAVHTPSAYPQLVGVFLGV